MSAPQPSPSASPNGATHSWNGEAVLLPLPVEMLEALEVRIADRVVERLAGASEPDPYLDVDQAADYMSCKPKRVYDLHSQRRLRCVKDGSRLLTRRSWIDDYLETAR